MLRNDGNYEIYRIEFQWEKNAKEWSGLSFDSKWIEFDIYEKNRELFNSFSASGKCWQATGVHGTFDYDTAIKLLSVLARYSFKAYVFRVVKVTINQETEEVCIRRTCIM